MKKPLKIVIISVVSLLSVIIGVVGGFLIYASATTLKVKNRAPVEIKGNISNKITQGQSLSLLTYNVGYCALDEKQDCYFDGGKGVTGESKDKVNENIKALEQQIKDNNPDIFFVQEIDINSRRSFSINELKAFREEFKEYTYESTFAFNFKAGFIPIPVSNPFGRMEAGIATFSKYDVSEASREQLPIPFKWPISLLNLKRCLLVNRLPIAHSDKEVVLINLHLEAYDDGEGKAKQMAQLMNLMKDEYEKGNYVIAGGDFNQSFSNTNYQQFPKITSWECPIIDVDEYPSFTFSMDSALPTCRSLDKPYYNSDKATHQYWMLDGFIVSNNIQVDEIKTLDYGFVNTDHNPVKLNITLK